MFRGNFGGGMGGMNMQQLMKQAQKMQEDMQKKQQEMEDELENTVLTATAAGGMVEVEITGKKKLVSVKVKPEAVDPDDVEMLEDMLMAAVNEALDKATELETKLRGNMPNLGGLM